jgi:hypothetical protein
VPERGARFLSQIFHRREDEAALRFSQVWKRESERALRAAFPGSEMLLDAEMDWLRPRLPDPWQFEIVCHLIGVVLSGRQTSVSQVARETDISRQTVARHIAAVWALVLERFPGWGRFRAVDDGRRWRRWLRILTICILMTAFCECW